MDFDMILTDLFSEPSENMIKLGLLIIIFAIIYFSIHKTKVLGANKGIEVIISLIVSVLAIQFMSFEYIEAILVQYESLGFLFITLLPLVIVLLFAYKSKMNAAGRKIILGLYAIIFGYLWYQNKFNYTDQQNNISIFILGTVIVFILADKQIKNAFKDD